MDIIRFAIEKPVAVTVAVLLIVMFGLIGLTAIPIQLSPTVDRPIITVSTRWPGRSPQEIVDEITREQEERLKSIANLDAMRSISRESESEITLEFHVGSSIDRALQEVADALRQVPEYPDEVDEPTIKAADGASENAIAWVIIDLDPAVSDRFPDFDPSTLHDFLDREVKPYLERVEGVAQINVFGGREREVQVLLDPVALAQRGLSHTEVLAALAAQNRNVSAGAIAEGKRDYRIRVLGQFETARDVLDAVVAYRDKRPVYVRDLGQVEISHQKARGFVRGLGQPCIAINAIRESGANVMEVMAELRVRLEDVRKELLPRAHPVVGEHLRLRQVYDETVYIQSAIDLVTENLWVGGALASLTLLLFLRSFVTTGVIALSIPISVIGTFLVLLGLGRNLNVISLAGLAFATGMVVDNGIVVLENIYRHVQLGVPPRKAAYRGAQEVWGAVLASTLTTVAVFIPVLTIEDEAGQLFRDISLAVVGSVSLSLIVSITVIPSACARWLKTPRPDAPRRRMGTLLQDLFGLGTVFGGLAAAFARSLYWAMTGWRAFTVRPAVIVGLTAASLVGAVRLMPPLDYLPPGNRNLVFGGLLIPPGYSVEQQVEVAERIEAKLRPYAAAKLDDPESVRALPSIPRMTAPGQTFAPVPVDNFFIGGFRGGMFVGATSQDPESVLPIASLVTAAMNGIPDAFGGASQASIFGRVGGGGNTIDLEIAGPRLDQVVAAARMMFGVAAQRYGYGSVRPDPSNFNLAQPETQLRLNERGRELQLTIAQLSVTIRGLVDGAFVGEMRVGGEPIDLVVLPSGGRLAHKELLDSIPVATPSGAVVPLSSVVDVVPGLAPQEIQRIEELPSVTIRIMPPQGRALEDVMEDIRTQVIAPAEASGLVTAAMRVRLEGTAAKLDEVKAALLGKASGAPPADWQRTLVRLAQGVMLLGVVAGALALAVAVSRRRAALAYGAFGIPIVAVLVAGLVIIVATQPQLATARFVWALVVTYLLMCALFESFVHPLVILFSVPFAVVGGFAGLRYVHEVTLADPTKATQQLDVLTMLGFVILIGVVVNNAILIVHQALNFMQGLDEDGQPLGEALPPLQAIAESVRTRMRPIFMTTATSLGGMLPLVVQPGAGSEMYRGLGAVLLGGLALSTLFTLVLVPLLMSLSLEMGEGMRALLGGDGGDGARDGRGRGGEA